MDHRAQQIEARAIRDTTRQRSDPMMNSCVPVSAELGLSLVVPDHGAVPLVASLYYSAEDPYAIRMAFHVGTDEPVEWILARDLLAGGLEGPAGEGAVQVWPPGHERPELLNIALPPPFGDAHFEAPRASTAAFLSRTYEVISAGNESEYIDVAAELDDLLWR